MVQDPKMDPTKILNRAGCVISGPSFSGLLQSRKDYFFPSLTYLQHVYLYLKTSIEVKSGLWSTNHTSRWASMINGLWTNHFKHNECIWGQVFVSTLLLKPAGLPMGSFWALRCPGTLNCFVFISFWYWRCEVSKVTLVLHKSWYSRAYLVSPSYIYILNLQMSLFRKHSLINLMYSDVLCGTLKFKVKYLPIQLIGKQAAQINSQKWFTNNN